MGEIEKQDAVKRLKRALEDVGITQAKAARRLKITPSYLNRIFSGAHVPGDDLALEIEGLASKLDSIGLKAV